LGGRQRCEEGRVESEGKKLLTAENAGARRKQIKKLRALGGLCG
jgi:hypothetical protein